MLKRKGVIAVPGEYKYGDMTEIKDPEELRLAVERQPIIMITHGHPVDGMPSAKDVIGTVSQKWNEKAQRVEGEFWFHEEKIPESVRDRIVNLEPVSISPGFMIDGIEENVQKGIVYTHVAVLDDEDPRCPLGECGVNIRMDSKEPARLLRYDQKTELAAPEPDPEPEPEAAEAEPEPAQAEEEAPPVEAEPPAEQKPEVTEKEAVVEDIPREPEVVIPTSAVAREDDSGLVMVDGAYTYIPKMFRDKKENSD